MENDWQCKQVTVKERNAKLLECKLWTDCSFSVGAEHQIFHAHKLILASASPVFERMFYGHLAESTNKEIPIEEIKAETFSIMLNYIYTDELQLDSTDMAAALYYAAKKYMLDHLLKHCISYLRTQLSPTDALQTYEFSKFYDETQLMQAALEIMRNKTVAVISSPYFSEINVSTMVTLLEQDRLEASELELFKALDTLAKSKGLFGGSCDPANRIREMSEFRKALRKIYFLSIPSEKFAQEAAFSKLLMPEESLAILACLSQPLNINSRYPKGFAKGKRAQPMASKECALRVQNAQALRELLGTNQSVKRTHVRNCSNIINVW